MNNEELHRKFGVTGEQLDAWADEYESADWSHMRFGDNSDFDFPQPTDAKPTEEEADILKAVEDWRAGRLKTYSLEEVERHLGLDD